MSGNPRSQTNWSGRSTSRNVPRIDIPVASCGSISSRSKIEIISSRWPGTNVYRRNSTTGRSMPGFLSPGYDDPGGYPRPVDSGTPLRVQRAQRPLSDLRPLEAFTTKVLYAVDGAVGDHSVTTDPEGIAAAARVAVALFSCGSIDGLTVIDELVRRLGLERVRMQRLDRGLAAAR